MFSNEKMVGISTKLSVFYEPYNYYIMIIWNCELGNQFKCRYKEEGSWEQPLEIPKNNFFIVILFIANNNINYITEL